MYLSESNSIGKILDFCRDFCDSLQKDDISVVISILLPPTDSMFDFVLLQIFGPLTSFVRSLLLDSGTDWKEKLGFSNEPDGFTSFLW